MLHHKDPQYILVGKYKFLYGSLQNNQHFWHICKDPHIFHFDKQVLLGILDLSNTHTVCIVCMDLDQVYSLVDRSTQLCDFLLNIVH